MSKALEHESRILLAIEALKSGQIRSLRKAAAAFDVPLSTLHDRRAGRVTRQESQVGHRKLSPTEETALVQWIESMDDRGMSPALGYIRQMADLLIRERGSYALLDPSITAIPASDTTVGENWVRRFLYRHPSLRSRYSRKYDYKRALCEDPEKVLAWLRRVQKVVEAKGVLDCDIYNFDETGFQMGVASTAKVVTRSDRKNRPVVVQPGNREWVTVIECINSTGWCLDPMIILEGKVHISTWYEGSILPKTWRVAVSENGWTTDDLTFEWLQKVFEPQTRPRTTGRYRLIILDGHGSHTTPAFDKFCTEHSILTQCMPPHSSHLHQPLDVSCFSVLKQAYGDLVKARMALGVHHIDKPLFLELFQGARKKAFTSKNIKSGFKATGLIPLDPSQVLKRLQVKIRTPSPPAPEQPNSVLPLKTPANIVELDHLQRQRQKEISPTDRAVQKIIRGCQIAMHNATLLRDENSRLRDENARQKRKRAYRRAFIQTGGSMTIGEGIACIEARQTRGRNSQKAAKEAKTTETPVEETMKPTASVARKRAPPRCSICGSLEHNARKCPSK